MFNDNTYVAVNLDAIAHNFEAIADKVNVPVMVVLKANGYGHGAIEIARLLEEHADFFGVSSVSEALEIGRRADIPVHFAHIKALGADVHGQAGEVVALIEQARAQGQRVTADQYPWLASGSSLGSALLPRWSVDGGRAAFLRRMDDPQTAARIHRAMAENLARRGGAEALLLTGRGWPWSGQTLQAIAEDWGTGPVEAALRILDAGDNAAPDAQPAGRVASFNMDRDDVDLFMRQPWVVTSSEVITGFINFWQ